MGVELTHQQLPVSLVDPGSPLTLISVRAADARDHGHMQQARALTKKVQAQLRSLCPSYKRCSQHTWCTLCDSGRSGMLYRPGCTDCVFSLTDNTLTARAPDLDPVLVQVQIGSTAMSQVRPSEPVRPKL